jgi:Tubulin-tyrosine ligase family
MTESRDTVRGAAAAPPVAAGSVVTTSPANAILPRTAAATLRVRASGPPVLLVLCETYRRVNLRLASHLWLARRNGFRPIIVNWRHVRTGANGTRLAAGVEVSPQLRLRPLARGVRVTPAVVLHRRLLGSACERLVEQLARAHPAARLSYGVPWKVISRKWASELCFRTGERSGIAVARPPTYLVPKAQIARDLAEVARVRPLIFKPSTASQCFGIRLSTPRTFQQVAARLSRSRWPHFVAQDLITNGVLWRGRKVDLRLYLLVTFRPLRIKLYREGVARIAARPFHGAAADDGLAALTGCCYRRRQHQPVDNIPVTQLLRELATAGYRVSEFWEETESLLVNVFRCLASYPKLASVTHLERRFYLGGVDVLLTDCGGSLRPLFIETNHVPQLNGWGEATDLALRAVHSAWLADLRSQCLELAESPDGVSRMA